MSANANVDGMGHDLLENALEMAWLRYRRAVLHAHTCQACRCLRPCCVASCAFRATDREREWTCSNCLDKEATV